jgi:hypothetical protein
MQDVERRGQAGKAHPRRADRAERYRVEHILEQRNAQREPSIDSDWRDRGRLRPQTPTMSSTSTS